MPSLGRRANWLQEKTPVGCKDSRLLPGSLWSAETSCANGESGSEKNAGLFLLRERKFFLSVGQPMHFLRVYTFVLGRRAK